MMPVGRISAPVALNCPIGEVCLPCHVCVGVRHGHDLSDRRRGTVEASDPCILRDDRLVSVRVPCGDDKSVQIERFVDCVYGLRGAGQVDAIERAGLGRGHHGDREVGGDTRDQRRSRRDDGVAFADRLHQPVAIHGEDRWVAGGSGDALEGAGGLDESSQLWGVADGELGDTANLDRFGIYIAVGGAVRLDLNQTGGPSHGTLV